MSPFVLLAACRPDAPPPAPDVGYGLTSHALGITLWREGEALLELPWDGVRLGEVAAYEVNRSYDPYWPLDLAEGGVTWLAVDKVEGTLPNVALTFDGGASGTLSAVEAGEGRFELFFRPTPGDRPLAFLELAATIDPTEGLYGLGSALESPNRRGQIRATQLELDTATEALNNEAHVHLPFLIGTTGWGWLLRDDHPIVYDLAASAPDRVVVTVGSGEHAPDGLAFDLYAADHPLDVTARYWQATGLHRLPARWALGPWVWRDENDDQAQVESDLQTMRDLDLACSGVWIDRPYATGVNTFDFDAMKFPDPQAMIDLAHAKGYRMALWHTPYADPVEAAAIYDEGIANGYFPPVHPPVFIDWSEPVDYLNPDAFAWWQGYIDRYTAMGIEGYKLDYAEEILVGALGGRLPWLFWDGSDERTAHAEYQRQYHRVYAETLPEDGGFLLVRSGAWGDQVNGPIIWPGDLDATMDVWGAEAVDRDGSTYLAVGGLPASVVNALSLGPSGFPFYGADSGGYRHSPPDNETFVRWFEQTALSSVMQIGTSTNDVAWEPTVENGFDADTLDTYRDFVRLHLRLWPYEWTYATQIGEGIGRPILRPLGLAYPALGVHPGDQYLFGDSLLVAPVVTRGDRTKDVIFPPGRWIDWFRGTVHVEGTETVAAALDELPLFLAEGGIVPMLRPTIDTLAPTTLPTEVDSYDTTAGVLWVRVFPGDPDTDFVLFDGTTIEQGLRDGNAFVSVTGGDEFREGAMLEWIGTPRPSEVLLDGVAIPERSDLSTVEVEGGWTRTDAVGGTVFVRVPAGALDVTVVPAGS